MPDEKSDEQEFQVVKVPEDAVESVVDYVKNLGEPAPQAPDPRVSGTNCRFTTHGDLHCNDVDAT